MKMDPMECSETSAFSTQTSRTYTKENALKCCSSICSNTVAPQYVQTVLLLNMHKKRGTSLCTNSAGPHYVQHRSSSLCTNSAAPHYVQTTMFLIMYKHSCSLRTNTVAPHYVQTMLILIMYKQCCSSLCTNTVVLIM